MWRSPRREQSTTAPEAEHEHGAGQTSAPNVAPTSKTTPTKSKTTNFHIAIVDVDVTLLSSWCCPLDFTSSCFVLYQFFSPMTTTTTTVTTTVTTTWQSSAASQTKAPRERNTIRSRNSFSTGDSRFAPLSSNRTPDNFNIFEKSIQWGHFNFKFHLFRLKRPKTEVLDFQTKNFSDEIYFFQFFFNLFLFPALFSGHWNIRRSSKYNELTETPLLHQLSPSLSLSPSLTHTLSLSPRTVFEKIDSPTPLFTMCV